MATRKTTATTTKASEPAELNLDEKVTVRSIAEWETGFVRKSDGVGDITIPPKGSVRLSRNEIISQVQTGNKLLTGIDGMGSHATLIIEDEPTRIEVGFDSADGTRKQEVFSDELVNNLFRITKQDVFEKSFKKSIRTRAESFAIVEAISRLNLNDYKKIRFIEKSTGIEI